MTAERPDLLISYDLHRWVRPRRARAVGDGIWGIFAALGRLLRGQDGPAKKTGAERFAPLGPAGRQRVGTGVSPR